MDDRVRKIQVADPIKLSELSNDNLKREVLVETLEHLLEQAKTADTKELNRLADGMTICVLSKKIKVEQKITAMAFQRSCKTISKWLSEATIKKIKKALNI